MANTAHLFITSRRPAWTACLLLLLCSQAFAKVEKQETSPEAPPAIESPALQKDDTKVETKVENEVKVERSETTRRAKNNQTGTGYAYFGTTELGLLLTTPTGSVYPSLETTQGGVAVCAKLTGSVFTRRTALDLGAGFQYAMYKGKRIGRIVIIPDENDNPILTKETLNAPYTRNQWAYLFDGAARLRFKQNLQAGIVATGLYSPQSAEFSSLPDDEAPNRDVYSVFLGPQFLWETRGPSVVSRFGVDVSVSLTGNKRNAYLTKLSYGWGEYLNDATTLVRNKKETKTETKTVKEIITVDDSQGDIQENITFIFDSQTINFKLNSSELTERSVVFIHDVASAFLQDYDLWEKIFVEGHTDSRGSAEYNQTLSERRAQSIADELMKQGIPAPALIVKGYGSKKPIVKKEISELDYARNRRVEIKINSRKNIRRLQKRIEKIKSNFINKNDSKSEQ
ncbi:MAG: hypothetical protein RIR26_2485 [Pseudomonadota bacterium]